MASITLEEAEAILAKAPQDAKDIMHNAAIDSLEKLQDSCNSMMATIIHLDGIKAVDLAIAASFCDQLMSHLARMLVLSGSETDDDESSDDESSDDESSDDE